MHSPVFLLFGLSIVTLALLHSIAIMFSLYWVYLWFDIPMHILGGATVALGYQSRFLFNRFEKYVSFGFIGTIIAVLIVGGVWEVYEYLIDPVLTEYGIDTVIDLSMDVVGGVLGYGVARSVARLP